MPPGHPPKRHKIDPSRSQDATFSLLNFDFVLGSILGSSWIDFGSILGASGRASCVPKRRQNGCKKAVVSKIGFGSVLGGLGGVWASFWDGLGGGPGAILGAFWENFGV